MKKVLTILLLVLGSSGCLSIPKSEIVLPKCEPKIIEKSCPKPKQLVSLPNKVYIKLEGNNLVADEGGLLLLKEYGDMKQWIKQYYY